MKFQNPSLNFFLNGRKDGRTHKPKPICSPLFQSWGHKNGLYYLVYYTWYIALIESYYFLCFKKTIEQINRNMCPLSRKLFVMAYLSLQSILFYN